MAVLSTRQAKLKDFSMKYLFRKDKTVYYQVKVLINRITRKIIRSMLMFFLAWKDVRFQKSYNFPRNSNFERLLFDLFNIKSDCSY